MREIDEIRIEGDQLIIFDTKGERHRFKMGVPEQVYEEVSRALKPPLRNAWGVESRPTISDIKPALQAIENHKRGAS